MAKKSPGENNLIQIFQLIEDREKQIRGIVPFTGTYNESTEQTLFNGTLEELQSAFDSGKMVTLDGQIIYFIGSDSDENGVNKITAIMQQFGAIIILEVTADRLVNIVDMNILQSENNRVTEISTDSTDEQYPTAKAVYDFVGGKTVVYSSTVPTVNDTSIVTVVL